MTPRLLAALYWTGTDLLPYAVIMLSLLAAALLAYPSQVRGIPRPWRWLLPLLRGLAMAALAVSILRPVLVRSRSVEEEGAVVVLLDRSRSMGIADSGVPARGDKGPAIARLVALADGLKWLPEGVRSQAMAEVYSDIEQLRAQRDEIVRIRREVEFARLSGREAQEQRVQAAIEQFVALAESAEKRGRAVKSRSADHLQRLARIVRRERNENWLRDVNETLKLAWDEALRSQDAVDNQLYQTDEQVREACDELSRLSRLELSWLALRPLLEKLDPETPVSAFAIGDGVAPVHVRNANGLLAASAGVAAEALSSDLSGGLARALRQLGRQPVQAIILLSDGRQIGADESIPTGLLPSGVPVFTIHAASPHVQDLSIDQLDLPRAMFVNESLAARVTLRGLNMDMRRLAGDAGLNIDQWPGVTQPMKFGEYRPLQALELPPLRIIEPGMRKVVVSAATQPGEAEVANNRVERWVKVLGQRLKVTAVCSSPGWDFRYLRNALSRTSWVDLRDAVVVPGSTTLAMRPAEILQQDLVVLCDVPVNALGPEQWEAIRKLVVDRGGSVLIIPGLTHAQQAKTHPLAGMMPWPTGVRPAWRIWPGQTPQYHAAPSPAGAAALPLDDDPDASRRRWDDLPGFYRFLAIPELRATVRPLLAERESRMPLLTQERYGSGRVFFFAMDESWRWRKWVGDRDQDRFWLQLVRHAADEPYAYVSGAVSFDVDRLTAEPGENVRLRARLSLPAGDLPGQLELTVTKDGRLVKAVPLQQGAAQGGGRYAGTLGGLGEGTYELRLRTPLDGTEGIDPVLPLMVQRSAEAELANIAGDRDFLQRLADATGGRCLNLEQVGQLPQLLSESRERRPRTLELPLWQSAYLFLFVLGCWTIEWSMRKRFGLA